MYSLGFKRDFIASHFLIGGDWGSENNLHSHHYTMELKLRGESLDNHAYLVDLVDVENTMAQVIELYENKCLNELDGFKDINPSLELFCRFLCEDILSHLENPGALYDIEVVLWENRDAWASWKQKP